MDIAGQLSLALLVYCWHQKRSGYQFADMRGVYATAVAAVLLLALFTTSSADYSGDLSHAQGRSSTTVIPVYIVPSYCPNYSSNVEKKYLFIITQYFVNLHLNTC